MGGLFLGMGLGLGLTPSKGGGEIDKVPLNAIEVSAGDSITFNSGERSIADLARYFGGGKTRAIVGSNQGVSGNTTTRLLARQADGFALNPVLYRMRIGTNDGPVGGIPPATTISNLQQLLANALSTPSVKRIMMGTVLARNDATFIGNPTFATWRTAVNDWIRSYSHPKVTVVDYDLSTFDPSTMTADGLHPNRRGATVIGRYEAQRLAPYITDDSPLYVDPADFGNLLLNPSLSGIDGFYQTVDPHNVASSWRVRNFGQGILAAATKGVAADGQISQIVTLNGTAAANGNVVIDCPNIPYSGVAGEQYELWAHLKIENGANLGAIVSISDGCVQWGGNTLTAPFNQDLDGVIRLQAAALGGSDTSNTPSITLYFASGVTVTNMVVTLDHPTWRKIT